MLVVGGFLSGELCERKLTLEPLEVCDLLGIQLLGRAL